MRALLLALAISGCATPAAPTAPAAPTPEDPGADDLTADLETFRADKQLPAITAMVWKNGVLVGRGVTGVRKTGDTVRATLEDRWHLGSNTKAMTATLIGIHVDRGTLRWDATLATLLPDERLDAGYATVTLEQLLQHRGGAPAEPPDDLWEQLWKDGAKPAARSTFVRALLARPPAQTAGTFAYSNAGYMIAGHILERATRTSWEQLMRDELFAPLGMTSCGFGPPGVDQPWGHDGTGVAIAPGPAADNPPGLGPAGTVHCALADYGKFLAVHTRTSAKPLVTPATLTRLHTPPEPRGYAGGWLVATGKLGPVLAHSGSNTMWYAATAIVLDAQLAIVVAANHGDPAVEQLLPSLVARYTAP